MPDSEPFKEIDIKPDAPVYEVPSNGIETRRAENFGGYNLGRFVPRYFFLGLSGHAKLSTSQFSNSISPKIRQAWPMA
jgi:hypothetical protein